MADLDQVPDFFIVGAPKCATTSLWEYLNRHPSVVLPEPKEPHFFGEHFPRSGPEHKPTIDEYLRPYRSIDPSCITGEASSSYLLSTVAASQIAAANPSARIIIQLRNPVERAFSHYWHKRRSGEETLSFERALEAEEARTKEDCHYGFRYVACGLYFQQVARYMEEFGPDAVLIGLVEDLEADSERVVESLITHLGASPVGGLLTRQRFNVGGQPRFESIRALTTSSAVHRLARFLPTGVRRGGSRLLWRLNTKPVPSMDPQIRSRLLAFFQEDIQQLSHLIDRDLSHWLSDS